MFWDSREDDMWGWAIQLGALFAIAAAVLGGVSFFHLLHATCFSLDTAALQKIYKTYFACALLSLLTFIALATSPCNILDSEGGVFRDEKCTRFRTHLDMGATSEIVAIFFFLWAGWKVKEYSELVHNGELPHDEVGSDVEMTHKDEEMEHLKEEEGTPTA
jgi:hypothetical protein